MSFWAVLDDTKKILKVVKSSLFFLSLLMNKAFLRFPIQKFNFSVKINEKPNFVAIKMRSFIALFSPQKEEWIF